MTLIDRTLSVGQEDILDLSQHTVELVLSPAEMRQVNPSDAFAAGMRIGSTVLPAEAALPPGIAEGASLLCVEVVPGSVSSIARIADIRRAYPELPVIAAVRNPPLGVIRTLLRLGVRDVIELPIDMAQLAEAVCDHLTVGVARRGVRGRLISIVKSTGGVGATNVGVHLASALATQARPTCMFDLDVQFGNAATYLGAPSGSSLTNLMEGGRRVDVDFLRAVAVTLPSGLRFVPPPPEIGPLEALDLDQLERVLRVARSDHDFVIADMPSNWANWTLGVVAQSDLILLVVNLTIASLRQGRRQLQLLEQQGFAMSKVVVLVNRVERRLFKTISLEDAAKALGHPVSLSVHNDYPLMSAANNQGVVVTDINRRSTVAKDFARIAEEMAMLVGGEE